MQLFGDDLSHKQHRCQKQNAAWELCCSKDCPEGGIICQTRDCVCNKKHENCHRVRLDKLVQKVNEKHAQPPEGVKKGFQQLEVIYQHLTANISESLANLESWKRYYGLNPFQEQLIKALENKDYGKLTGKLVRNVDQNLQRKLAAQSSWFDLNWVDQFWEYGKRQFEDLMDGLKNVYRGQVCVIRNLNNGNALKANGDLAVGTRYDISEKSQHFLVMKWAKSGFKIKSLENKKYLTSQGWSIRTQLAFQPPKNSDAQLFRFCEHQSNGSYMIKLVGVPGQVADLDGGKSGNNTKVHQYDEHGKTNQYWSVEYIGQTKLIKNRMDQYYQE